VSFRLGALALALEEASACTGRDA